METFRKVSINYTSSLMLRPVVTYWHDQSHPLPWNTCCTTGKWNHGMKMVYICLYTVRHLIYYVLMLEHDFALKLSDLSNQSNPE